MDTWTKQMGYPVVTVTKSGGDVTFTQSRFLLDGTTDPNDKNPFQYKWQIPLTYTTKSEGEWNYTKADLHWMEKDGTAFTQSGLTDADWIIANIGQMGFYRVNYDDDNWKKIVTQLNDKHDEIGLRNRAQILDDAFNLARAEIKDYPLALDLTKYLENEKEYLPWEAAITNLRYIRGIISQTSHYGDYMKYLKKIAQKNIRRFAQRFIRRETCEKLSRGGNHGHHVLC